MLSFLRSLGLSATLAGGLFILSPLIAGEPPVPTQEQTKEDVPTLNLLDAVRDGTVSVSAEGSGDGRMTLSVTNRTKRQLRVVLPPGLIASGATGQFGGMGGMGGGMGGMGGMGGGMGGMGGGMGGMGGGMGGMGGGMGGMGGGMGGGMMGGGTLPASMGMMMLGRLIMSLIGDRDSWDQSSLMMGMMGGMGGGMMGGMGGGMGGMGGGMMGGMGGGMRSVPPTSLPFANLKSDQTRHLPTRLVGLSQPDPGNPVAMPAKGEKLELGDINQMTTDTRVQKALRRLAADKAPPSVSQLVMWRVSSKLDWETIARMSKGWSNAHELSLARDFVEKLDTLPEGDSGALLCEIRAADESQSVLAGELSKIIEGKTVLGLPVKSVVPNQPEGPAVACRVQVIGTAAKPEAQVQVAKSDGAATAWVPVGKFTLPIESKDGKIEAVAFADALADGILGRLVRGQLSKGPMVKGKQTYKIRIDNASPLILNGLAVQGPLSKPDDQPKVLAGISIPPSKNMTVPATAEVVEELGLRKGIRIIAADLSGL